MSTRHVTSWGEWEGKILELAGAWVGVVAEAYLPGSRVHNEYSSRDELGVSGEGKILELAGAWVRRRGRGLSPRVQGSQ